MTTVSRQISSKIAQKLSNTSKRSSNKFIFRINNLQRMTDEAAYEPKMVSIGPYHRGKINLQKMENYKFEYLQGILNRKNESSAERYIDSLIDDEEAARSYYAEDVSLSQEEFVEMMLLDGCFIVELLRKSKRNEHDDRDLIFKIDWIWNILRRDLLLFENQIPFFILEKLFDMTRFPNDDDEDLIFTAILCLNNCITVGSTYYFSSSRRKNVLHLLSLMYEGWYSAFTAAIDEERGDNAAGDQNGSDSDRKKRLDFSCISILGKPCFCLKQHQEKEDTNGIMFIKSVSELKKDGIKFVKSNQNDSWLDIKFENGEIKIPPLVIQDGTESILKNLIAYEQHMFDLEHSEKFFTDYTTFMDFLINTPKDVQELRVKGIIKNWLGDDKQIIGMFKEINNNIVFLSRPNFTYRKIFKKVNEHCSKRRNTWISDLKQMYFKNPWSIISLLAATLLLVLTSIQTVFSILQNFKKDPNVVCNCK